MAPSIAQAAVGSGLAWLVATQVLGHTRPFFAPIAVLISVGIGLGQRLRRVAELVVGRQPRAWASATCWSPGSARAPGRSPWWWRWRWPPPCSWTAARCSSRRSASSAVLVAAVLPGDDAGGFDRMLDALTGGLIGLAAVALMPASPLTLAAKHAVRGARRPVHGAGAGRRGDREARRRPGRRGAGGGARHPGGGRGVRAGAGDQQGDHHDLAAALAPPGQAGQVRDGGRTGGPRAQERPRARPQDAGRAG